MKRTISFLLSLAMIITMLPAGAFAAELETTPVVETQAVTEPAEQETEAAETTAAETEPVETTAVETEPTEIPEETTAPTEETVPEPTEAVVEETTEIAAEETEEAAAEQTMSFEAFKEALSRGTVELEAKVIIAEDLTVENRLEVMEGGEIIVPDGVTLTLNASTLLYGGKLTVEAGGKLINNSWLPVYEGAALTVNGTYYASRDGELHVEYEKGTVTGVANSLVTLWGEVSTEEEMRAMFALEGYGGCDVYLNKAIRLTSDLEVGRNQELIVFAHVELTVPSGVTLTVKGHMSVFRMAVEPGGTLRVYQTGDIWIEYGYFHAEGGTVETVPGAIRLNLMEVEVIGADTSLWNAECQINTYEELLMAVDACSRYNFVDIYLRQGITVEDDLTIPENAVIIMHHYGELKQLIIPTGVTVINYGMITIGGSFQLWIQEGGVLENWNNIACETDTGLVVDGTFNDYGYQGGGGGNYGGVTTFEELKAAVGAGEPYIFVSDSIVVAETLTVDARLNIYGGGEIIVPDGVTLTLGQYQEIWISGGKLIVEQGGSLVNNAYVMVEAGGALDVRGSFSMGASGLISLIWHNGEVINGVDHSLIHAQGNVYTEGELRAMLGQTDYKTVIVSLHESVRLSSDLYIAENMRLMMDGDPELGEGPELIVPSGVTLTVDGDLNMYSSGITVEPGGTLRVNESAWVQMYYGYIHAEGATVETAVGRIHMYLDGNSEILGVDTSLVNGTCKVENMDDLWKAVGLCSLYNFVEIEPYTTITVESDLTIPGNAMFAMYDQGELMQLIIPDGVTVISYADVIINDNCQIWIQEGGTLELCGGINDYTGCGFIVDGTLIDNSPGEGGGGNYGGVTTFEELKAAIEAGSGDIDINGSITVTENLMVPENCYVFINYDSELIIPSGVSFTTYSGMSIFGGKVTVEDGGAFAVAAMYINGTFIVHPGATFTLLETGNMTVRYGDEAVVIGVPQNSYTLEYYAENEADIRSGLALTGYGWVSVHLFADVTLASNLTIPESTSLIIDTRWNENGSDGGTLTIPKGKTVTNNGYLTAGSPEGRLVIDKGGKVINNSDLMNYGYLVNNGEIVNNGGCYFQGEISGDGIITGNGYVSYTGHAYSYADLVDLLSGNRVPTQINIWGEVTLEGDVTIPEDTRLNLDGEGNTLIVPDGVTLTVKGELCVQYGGVATFEKGSKLINVYEVMAFHGGTINIYGTYVRENPDANLALYAEGIINGVANSSIHYADSFADEASLQAILNKVKTEGYGQVTVYIQYGSGQVEITGDVTIPEGGYLLIGSDSLMLKPGAKLTNNGEIHVYSPAQLIVDSGAELIDNGKIYAEEGCIIYLGGGIALSADAQQILGKGKANITAALTPASSAKITWTLAEGDELYATLKGSGSKAVLTAADVTGKKTVKVIASAKLANGAEVSDTIEITIVPLTKQIALLSGGKDVTGQTITHDLASQNVTLSMDLTAVVAPGDAGTALTWTSSDEAIATVKDGKVSFTAREGKVTITASATDGSKVSAKVTIDAVYLIQGLELKEGASELVGGNGTQLKVIDSLAPGKELGRGDVIWTLAKEADAAYVSVTPDGKVTTKAVPEKITVKLLCSVAANPEAKALEHTITIYPAVAQVDLVDGDEIYTGRTIKLSRGGVIILQAKQYPVDSMEGVTWDISDKAGKFVEILSSEGETLILKSTGVKGNVTVKITAADGSKKSASVKIQTGTYVEKVTVTSPVIDLVSGEKVQLTATPYPADADNIAVVWSLEDPNDKQYVSVSSSGLVSAKKGLSMSKPITVVATAKDGSGAFGSFALQLQPADPGALVILAEDNANVTGTTIDVDLLAGGSIKLKAKYFNTDSADVTWSGKNVTFSTADADGYVTATVSKKGNFTVTADDGSGKKASVKLKAANLSEMIQISGPTAVSSGKSIQLTATVLPQGKVADKKVTWWIDPVHTQYATISSSGKLTATKNLTEARNISVWAQAKDGNSEPEMFCVDILPLAQSVQILESGIDVTNTNYVWDLAVDEGNPVITAEVLAADASQAVVWKLSGAKVLQQNADGTFSVTGKAGTATVTATAADGSGKKASFKFTVVKSMEYIQQAQTEAVIAGDKSLKLASFVTVDKTATNQKLVWSMSGDTEVATLNATGVLKTKKVTAVHTITVTATAADGSGCQAEFTVYIYPATTSVKLLCDGNAAPKQATLGIGGTMTLEGISLPSAAAQGPGAYTWKLSSDKFAEIRENADGTVTITGKAAGTVTVTCTAADGTGKKATLKIKIG